MVTSRAAAVVLVLLALAFGAGCQNEPERSAGPITDQLKARERTQDRTAQPSARNAITAAKVLFTDNEDYREATVATMSEVEPSLTFTDDQPSTGPTAVSIAAPSADEFRVAVLSESGSCFALRDVVDQESPDLGTRYAQVRR